MVMSMNQLVELTGKTYRTVKKRLAPLKPVGEDGRSDFYDTKDALTLLYPTIATELAQENLLLERARREKMEIEVGQLRGQLVPVQDIAKVLGKEYAFLRSHVRSIPAKLAKPLSMVSDPNEVHVRLMEAVDECLSELTADATYQLEQDKLNAARNSSVFTEANGAEADTEIEPGSMGGQPEIPES